MRPAEFHTCFRPFRATSFLLLALAALLLPAEFARATGPRWVTGPPYFAPVPAGQPVVWYTSQLSYLTDPGDLSTSVNHAAADAIVAAAASVWNVPTSAIMLSQGGTLSEDVNSGNTSMSAGDPVFPADVQTTNFAAGPIAVLYDSDGSIINMLLGPGASDPTQCTQNGVIERVDSITPFGAIQHAVLIVNGRCSGPAPEQQLQLQYQLERAFGRILGLAWSQVNDNVFMQWRLATDDQKLHWPIMHPIDRTCGAYTYQCLPQPFTLRDDDIASISSLYPVASPAPSGKIPTWQNAARITGTISFPSGEGMQGVNIVVHRVAVGSTAAQDYQDTSSVSGFLFQQNAGNPVSGAPTGISGSLGSTDPQLQGFYDLAWVPEIDGLNSGNGPTTAIVTTEPINPLYTGAYAVGPYVPGQVTPSGSVQSATIAAPPYDGSHPAVLNFTPSDAAADCTTADGTELAPKVTASTGLWTGLLCGRSHSAWSTFSLAAQRTATIEVTALDQTGAATTAKTMPVIGAWSRSDLPSSPPTLAATQSAFNTIALGVSAAHLYAAQATDTRFVIADARGDGRPDFPYRARLLYAATVQPATIPLSGGQITITGTGFTPDVRLQIGGASATILQSTSTSLVVTAPASSSARTVDIAITDPTTGGSASMYSALTYSATAPSNRLTLVSAPSGNVTAGTTLPTPFSVRVFQSDGVTPVASMAVTFSVASGPAQLNACGGASCTLITDATGLASTTVATIGAGTISLLVSTTGATQSATFNAAIRSLTPVRTTQCVAPGATVIWPPQVTANENGAPAAGISVTWTGSGSLTFATTTTSTNATGVAQSAATLPALASGTTVLGQACAWTTVCTSISAVAVDPSAWRVALVSGGAQTIASSTIFTPVVVRIVDTAGHPIASAPVVIHQTITAATMPCPAHGACPVAPTLDAAVTTATSDTDGLTSITPMQMQGTAETTNMVVATGSEGFLQLSLQQLP
jgi:hypothetical protein